VDCDSVTVAKNSRDMTVPKIKEILESEPDRAQVCNKKGSVRIRASRSSADDTDVERAESRGGCANREREAEIFEAKEREREEDTNDIAAEGEREDDEEEEEEEDTGRPARE